MEYKGRLVDFPVTWICDRDKVDIIKRYDVNGKMTDRPNWEFAMNEFRKLKHMEL